MRCIWLGGLALGLLLLGAAGGAVGQVPDAAVAARPDQSGWMAARVAYSDRSELEYLTSRLDVWEVHPQGAGGWLLAYLSPAEWDELTAAGYRPQIDATRTAAVGALPGQIQHHAPQAGGIPGYPCYATVAEIYAELEATAAFYTYTTTLNDLGPSWERLTDGPSAGYEIQSLTITNKTIPGPKPTLFVLAGVHARELAPVESAMWFIRILLDDAGNPQVRYLLDRYQVEVLPLANPDGRVIAEQGYLQRKNTNRSQGSCAAPPLEANHFGVDLNRNNDFHWNSSGAATAACAETYAGTTAASESETQAIAARLRQLFPDRRGPGDLDPADPTTQGLFITLHSYGSYVMWPWSWSYMDAPDAAALASLGRRLAYYTHYWPQPSSRLYPASGTNDDWVYGELGAPAFTIEMGTDFFQDCASYEATSRWELVDALYYALGVLDAPYTRGRGPEVTALSRQPDAPQDWPRLGEPVVITATVDGTRQAGGYTTGPIQAARAVWAQDLQHQPPLSVALTALDGAFDEAVEEVSGTLPAPCVAGEALLVVEGQADGVWGPPQVRERFIGSGGRFVAAPTIYSFQPGEVLTYTFILTNRIAVNTVYTLALDQNLPEGWMMDFPVSVGPLGSCETLSFPLTLHAPPTAAVGTRLNLTLTAWDRASDYAAAQLQALVGRVGFELGAPPLTALYPGRTQTVRVPITNTGELPLMVELDYAWSAGAQPVTVNVRLQPLEALAPGQRGWVTLEVIAPRGLAYPPPREVAVTLFAQEDPRRRQTLTLPLAGWPRLLLPLLYQQPLPQQPTGR